MIEKEIAHYTSRHYIGSDLGTVSIGQGSVYKREQLDI